MIKEDYLIREIKKALKFLRKLLGIEREEDKFFSEEMGQLDRTLADLVGQGRINQAENILFENFSEEDEFLLVAIRFYENLNMLSEQELTNLNFTKGEIKEGLIDIMGKLKIPGKVFMEE